MLNPLSVHDARRLSDYFREAEYSREGMRRTLIANELTSARLRNLPQLLYRTADDTAHNLLIRWFAMGVPVDNGIACALIPRDIEEILLRSGLLYQSGDSLHSGAMLNPFEEMLIAADHSLAIESGADPNVVLGLNATTWLLYRFTIQKPRRLTLDLGCGGGAQALAATRYSERVFATDLNPRAMNFLEFNASLNGLSEKIESGIGDRFEPVAGRKFDLIVANPPFFITPSFQNLYCENRFELDEFCRELVVQAPAHLEEGGYFQMVFEWVELEGQDWIDRLSGWAEHTGCDVSIYKSYSQDPSRYAQERVREGGNRTPEEHAKLFSEWMKYYEGQRVQAIHGGLLAMRRRSGKNWLRIGEMPVMPGGYFGESVAATFLAQDILQGCADELSLLNIKPMLSPQVRLDQQFRHSNGLWESISLQLSLPQPLPATQALGPDVAEFLRRFDGQRSLKQIVDDVTSGVTASRQQVREECLAATRRLIEMGFVVAG